MMIKIAITALLGLVLLGCGPTNANEKIATELCDCMGPLAEQYRRIQEFSATGGPEELEALLDDVEAAADQSDACTARMEERYGDLKENRQEIEAAMEQICPDISAMLRELDQQAE